MARLTLRILIGTTPERVWQILSDLPSQGEWMVDVRSLEIIGGQTSGAGTVIAVTSELFGLPVVKDRMRITTWQPPHRYDVVHEGQFTGTGAFIIEAVPSGSVFTWIEDFRPPLGPLGEIGFSLLVGPHLRRVFTRSMQNVRHLAEASS